MSMAQLHRLSAFNGGDHGPSGRTSQDHPDLVLEQEMPEEPAQHQVQQPHHQVPSSSYPPPAPSASSHKAYSNGHQQQLANGHPHHLAGQQPSFLAVPSPSPTASQSVFNADTLAAASAAAGLTTLTSSPASPTSPDYPTSPPSSAPPSPRPSSLERERVPSPASATGPRVFPRPPPDGAPAPTIRPGSVRSISFESRPANGVRESPDDDRASRGSRRSVLRSATGSSKPRHPPIPPLPAHLDSGAHQMSAEAGPSAGANGNPSVSLSPAPREPPKVVGSLHPPPRMTRREMERAEASDRLSALPISPPGSDAGVGVIPSFDHPVNRSVQSLGNKQKDDKPAVDPRPSLACLYLVSGLGKDPSQWALSDKDSTQGVQPLEDSLAVFWRPDMLGSTFSGEKSEDWGKKGSQRSMNNSTRREVTGRSVPGTGPDGPSRLVARTMKYSHPKDVEVVNSTLAPPTTCHTFSFSVARQSSLDAMTAQRNKTALDANSFNSYVPSGGNQPTEQGRLRESNGSSDLVFYGVTLTVWSHADKDRSQKLKEFKQRRMRLDSMLSDSAARDRAKARRSKTPWMPMALSSRKGGAASDYTASETGMSDSDIETTFTTTDVDYSIGDISPAYGENCDVFWLPYALTLVSRYPIYDVMQDYLRLSWARYSKDARAHMRQIFSLLNTEAPRPGDVFRIPIGLTAEDEVTVEATMPGALDFDKGTIKVDFQLWPIFQALDVDHIMTIVEVALSNSGRVIFCSRHPAMLGAAVETLKYIVELRGWNGIALPNIHARDTTFVVEDPGPYIIGMATECRYMISVPPEVVIVDLDMNALSYKSLPPNVVTPRHKREKARAKLLEALGPDYPAEKSVPTEYRVSFPKGSFRNIHRIYHGPARPRYLSGRLSTPNWWHQSAVIAVFDKIMADRHKKPSLFKRLTKSGFARQQEQLTANERLAKLMMRKRALHYVEKRDDFELKVARITRRLQKLVQEGEQWKHRFETFEKYAERLSREAEDLKAKIDREQREARRLSNINSQQEKVNNELQEKLSQTEDARAEAMRQLSDMHHSIQELERERNEIMDIIELQITSALQHLPYVDLDDGTSTNGTCEDGKSQPTSPRTISSTPTNNSIRRKRPQTRDSTQTTFSVDSSGKPMSVLGQLNEGSVRRGLGSILDMDQVSSADRILALSKSDGISHRVAIIQAKLELALAPVHHLAESMSDEQHEGASSANGDTSTEVVADESRELNDDEAPGTARLSSPSLSPTSDLQTPATVAVTAPSDDGTDDCATPIAEQTDTAGHDTPRRSILRPRPNTFRPVVLRPPPRRVKQQKSYESVESTPGSVKSDKRASLRASREIILTPVDSIDSMRYHDDRRKERTVDLDDRPASVISTTTVTFG